MNYNNLLRTRRPNPCHGCPDRYPGCSDHFQKPAFLEWKAEQAKIRENRRNYHAPKWAEGREPYVKKR